MVTRVEYIMYNNLNPLDPDIWIHFVVTINDDMGTGTNGK